MINLKQHYPISAIYDLVERLYFEIKKHKEFYEKFFKGIKLEELIRIQKETFAYLFGYTDKDPNVDLYESHKHLNIKDEDWHEFVQIFTKVLKDAHLPEEHIQHILEKVSGFKNDIIKKD